MTQKTYDKVRSAAETQQRRTKINAPKNHRHSDGVNATIAEIKALNSEVFDNFLASLKSPRTVELYMRCLQYYKEKGRLASFADILCGNDPIKCESLVCKFVRECKAEGLSYDTCATYIAPLRSLFEFARIAIVWKNVVRLYPSKKRAKDEAPDIDAIRRIYRVARSKPRAFISLVYSTGMRVGGIYWIDEDMVPHYLQMRDLVPIDEFGIFKIIVYRGANEEYATYCSPQARRDLEMYFDERKAAGEEFTPESPVFRDDYDASKPEMVHNVGVWTNQNASPIMNRLMKKAGVRHIVSGVDGEGNPRVIRYSFKQDHGFRKAFETALIDAGMRELWIDALEGHAIKGDHEGSQLRGSYYRPKDDGPILRGTMRPDGIKNLGYVDCMHLLNVDNSATLEAEKKILENTVLAQQDKIKTQAATITDQAGMLHDAQAILQKMIAAQQQQQQQQATPAPAAADTVTAKEQQKP